MTETTTAMAIDDDQCGVIRGTMSCKLSDDGAQFAFSLDAPAALPVTATLPWRKSTA